MSLVSLGDPIRVNGVTIKNRFCKAAMSETLAEQDGSPGPALEALYRTWAMGGVGLQITGNVMIDSRHCGEPGNVIIEDRENMAALQRWATASQENNTRCWVQLNHPGKQTPKLLCKEPMAPSSVPLDQGLDKVFNPPREMTEDDIGDVIARFARTALICKEAGFSGVQIHGAHGYLINQFLSSHHNRRTDRWGGALESRMRFLIEVYRAVRSAVGDDFPVALKLNSSDFQRGGFTEDESMCVVETIAQEGIDLIEISGGNYEAMAFLELQKDSTRSREAYFLDYAQKVRGRLDIPLVVTGGFRSARAMADALASQSLDLVGIARPLTLHPDFPSRALNDPDITVRYENPSTGFPKLDKALFMDVIWHEHQLKLLAGNNPANPRLSPWKVAGVSLVRQLREGISRQRRA